jgi:hypothetical protein
MFPSFDYVNANLKLIRLIMLDYVNANLKLLSSKL